MERETGIEPASLAWKARVLPLNYSRKTEFRASTVQRLQTQSGGGDWIRTSVGVSQQIYSLPPLATRAPLRRIEKYTAFLILAPISLFFVLGVADLYAVGSFSLAS